MTNVQSDTVKAVINHEPLCNGDSRDQSRIYYADVNFR